MLETLEYIISAPYFWHTMGWTTASAVFIGATLYNGDLKMLTKGIITIVPYGLMISAINAIRVANKLKENGLPTTHITTAYAGNFTVVIVTFFYVIGLIIGVLVTKLAHRKEK